MIRNRFIIYIKGAAPLIVLAAVMSASSARAADITAGRAKSVQCASCHGPVGIATLPEAPNLAGQNEIYLTKALRAYKAGDRKNEMMSLMVATLSDADIENLAAFYQSIEISVKKP
jgi:cytochrome c553